MAGAQHHYTDKSGYNGIGSARHWRFAVSKPPSEHPRAVYFTSLEAHTPRLAQRLRIPRSKLQYVFVFEDRDDLIPLEGGRGQFISYSETDYIVEEERQEQHGETGL